MAKGIEPRDALRLAIIADLDPRTIHRFLRGEVRTTSKTRRAIEAAALELGLTLEGVPSGSKADPA